MSAEQQRWLAGLYEANFAAVVRRCRVLLKSAEDAADAAHEVFLIARNSLARETEAQLASRRSSRCFASHVPSAGCWLGFSSRTPNRCWPRSESSPWQRSLWSLRSLSTRRRRQARARPANLSS